MSLLWASWPLPSILSSSAKRWGSSVTVGILAGRSVPQTTRPRMQLEATLCWNHQSLFLPALEDSGADENFLDASLVSQACISVEPLTTPLDANALNGMILARVTHRTKPLCLILSGNHRETIQFHVIPSPHGPIVLGQPWLR